MQKIHFCTLNETLRSCGRSCRSPEASDFTAYEYHWNVLPILIVREISFCTGLFARAEYALADKRFTVPARLRTDGCKLFGAHGW